MSSPGRYDDTTKTEALRLYQQVGTSETHRRLGMSRSTIITWAHEAGIVGQPVDEKTLEAARVRRLEKRELIRDMLQDRTIELLERMEAPGKPLDVFNLAKAVGTLIDKYRLEAGEYTDRTYHEGSDDIDRRVAQLVSELNRSG